jgi:hypothetical protein
MFLKLWEIEDQGRNRQILQRQIRDLFFKAFNYFKPEVESDGAMHGVAVSQDHIVDGCDVGFSKFERNIVSQHCSATHRHLLLWRLQ